MAHLVVLVLDDPNRCHEVLRAWEEAGVPGATILESTGMARMARGIWDDLPLVPSMRDILAGRELHHRTVFAVVKDEETVDRLFAATQQVLGDLDLHHTGIMFSVPVTRVAGLERKG